jgi:hypothetical protein
VYYEVVGRGEDPHEELEDQLTGKMLKSNLAFTFLNKRSI